MIKRQCIGTDKIFYYFEDDPFAFMIFRNDFRTNYENDENEREWFLAVYMPGTRFDRDLFYRAGRRSKIFSKCMEENE